MSDYHVRESSRDGRSVRVIFHVPVPVEVNQSGKPLRDSISEGGEVRGNDGSVRKVRSELKRLDSAERINLENGVIVEVVESIHFKANATKIQKTNKIDAKFNKLKNSALKRTRTKFELFGLNRNVV